MKYAWITSNKSRWPITLACDVLGVSASGYFEHLRRKNLDKPAKPGASGRMSDERLLVEIRAIHAEVRQEYGWPKMCKELVARGHRVGKERVRRLMQKHGIRARCKRKFVVTTDSNHDGPIFPDLAKDVMPDRPNQLWVADLTYVAVSGGFVYLAAILDAWSRKVVGYAISRSMEARVAVAALKAAIKGRNPPKGCIHHSDRGSQYASEIYRELLAIHGLVGSMSRRGNPYDNAKAESFFKTLKREEVYLKEYQTFAAAQTNLAQFIDDVYNTKRLHSSLGYRPPAEFEEANARSGKG